MIHLQNYFLNLYSLFSVDSSDQDFPSNEITLNMFAQADGNNVTVWKLHQQCFM